MAAKKRRAKRSKATKSKVRVVLGKLQIRVAKIPSGSLADQRARMMSSDGCISNPGGPSC
jgi:hypothetical protein